MRKCAGLEEIASVGDSEKVELTGHSIENCVSASSLSSPARISLPTLK